MSAPDARSETLVHTTAVVHPEARLGAGVRVDAYAVVERDVALGEGCHVGAHAVLHAGCRLGRRVIVSPHAVIGGAPQVVDFAGAASGVEVGDDSVLREYVTVHRALRDGATTRIGRSCLLMALSHVGHDCEIGDGAILTSYAGLSGHIEVGEGAVIGGHAGLHQFVRVGRLAMVGGAAAVTKDVPPYVVANGNPCRVRGLNSVGLRRAHVPPATRSALKQAFRLLYRSGLNTGQALAAIREQLPDQAEIAALVSFVEASRRGITGGSRRAGTMARSSIADD